MGLREGISAILTGFFGAGIIFGGLWLVGLL